MDEKIREIEGDLFGAPDGAALIHACNTQGSWGAGIAKAFKERYPAAFQIYRSHCQAYLSNPQYKTISSADGKQPRRLVLPEGTALIIQPQEQDDAKNGKKHWIVCLFTSPRFGRNRSSPEIILENTVLAVADMKEQFAGMDVVGMKPSELWSCRFNAGLFAVDWKLSRQVLEDEGLEVTVVRPPGE